MHTCMSIHAHTHVHMYTCTHAGRDGVEVTFLVQEHGWLKSTVAAHAGTQSGDAVSGRVHVV